MLLEEYSNFNDFFRCALIVQANYTLILTVTVSVKNLKSTLLQIFACICCKFNKLSALKWIFSNFYLIANAFVDVWRKIMGLVSDLFLVGFFQPSAFQQQTQRRETSRTGEQRNKWRQQGRTDGRKQVEARILRNDIRTERQRSIHFENKNDQKNIYKLSCPWSISGYLGIANEIIKCNTTPFWSSVYRNTI